MAWSAPSLWFAAPWWSVMLSVSSCTCGPFVCFLRGVVYSSFHF
jgi:hypothetical protein